MCRGTGGFGFYALFMLRARLLLFIDDWDASGLVTRFCRSVPVARISAYMVGFVCFFVFSSIDVDSWAGGPHFLCA